MEDINDLLLLTKYIHNKKVTGILLCSPRILNSEGIGYEYRITMLINGSKADRIYTKEYFNLVK